MIRSRRAFVSARATQLRRGANVELLEPRHLLAGDPLIAEFQAINDSTLADEDGDFSDWIEIRNSENQPVELAGWHLTDNLDNLKKWQFPAGSSINAESELLVFASGKNRSDGAQGQLHTNFRLSGSGESLALVRPDGVSIAHSYDSYPPQLADQSYGLAVGRKAVELVGRDTSVRTFIPNDDSLGDAWQQLGFDDAAWQSGTLGVGYETLFEGVSEAADFSQPLPPEWTIDLPEGSSSTVNQQGDSLLLNVPNGDDLAFEERGVAPLVYRTVPDIPTTVSSWEVIARISQSAESNGQMGIAIVNEDGLPAIQLEYSTRRRFRMTAEGGNIGPNIAVRGLDSVFLRLQRSENSWTASFKVNAEDGWTQVGEAFDGEDGRTLITNPRGGLFARSSNGDMNVTVEQFSVEVPAEPAAYGPRISTDVSAMNGTGSSVYMRFPFQVDADVASLDELSLTANVDDGFAAYLNGDPLTVGGGEPLQVNSPIVPMWNSTAASEVTRDSDVSQQRFNLDSSIGELRPGENLLAIHGMNVGVVDKDFFFDATLTAADIVADVAQSFLTPTPGAVNEMPAAPTPIIKGQEGLFFGSTTVEMFLPEPVPSVEIRYTLDGSDPTPESTLYSGPVTLARSAMLQARAFDFADATRFLPSNTASGTFIAMDPALRNFSSNLPVLVLDGFGSLPGGSSNSLVGMNVAMLDTDEVTGRAALNSGATNMEYLGRGGARDRGSSTSGQPKPNMTFETWGATGTTKDDDEDVGWLGLASESDWVLHAPLQYDRSYARNSLGFDLSNQMDMWASNYRFIEVYLDADGRDGQRDGDDIISREDFMGVYMLIEKIEQGPGRLDIARTTPDDATEPDITGGYIWKFDRQDPDAPGFRAGGSQDVTIGAASLNWVYPKSPRSRTAREDQKATEAQQQWVIDYLDAFRATLDNPDINDPEGYSKYIDPEQWIDQHLLNTFTGNKDAFELSAYFHKDQNGRLQQGPVWDFDRSADSDDARDDDPLKWTINQDFFERGWYRFLFTDPNFSQLWVDRWQMWRDTVLSDEKVNRLLGGYEALLTEGASRAPFRSDFPPRTTSPYRNNKLDGTFQGEFNSLRQWLLDRGQFIDGNFAARADVLLNGNPLGQATRTVIEPGTEIFVTPPNEVTFVDDVLVDPTTSVGSYLVIGDDTLGDAWAATGFDDSDWASGPLGFGYHRLFEPFVQTSVDPRATIEGSTTFLARVDFEVNDPAAAQKRELLLRARYDDGFIVYLNGQKLQEVNLTGEPLAWNSEAKRANAPTDREDFDLTPFTNLLVAGTNTISFRVINSSPTGNDMLIQPELLSREPVFAANPNAVAYYTLDGTDPRGRDGQPSANAIGLTGGGSITVDPGTRLTVRNFDASFRGDESDRVPTNWSGPRVYDLIAGEDNPVIDSLRIAELNYNPGAATIAEQEAGFGNDDFEFIELVNRGSAEISLAGVRLTIVDVDGTEQGVDFDFSDSSVTRLSPGERVTVVEDTAAFHTRYGEVASVAGQWSGRLSNSSELLTLKVGDIPIQQFTYQDIWYPSSDGAGSSLVIVDADADLSMWNQREGWSPSGINGGSPGVATGRPGDVNRDGIFNSSDLTAVLQAGEFEDATEDNSTFEEGDWNGDGDFTTADLVLAFVIGRYVSGPVAAVQQQPAGFHRAVLHLQSAVSRFAGIDHIHALGAQQPAASEGATNAGWEDRRTKTDTGAHAARRMTPDLLSVDRVFG